MRVIFAFLAMVFAVAANADDTAAAVSYQEGVHYQELATPIATSNPEKIEVTEVFWYGCGHCFQFEPLVKKWQEKQAADVNFVKSPAMWNSVMETHARAFYTAKALGVLSQMNQPLFDALNVERKLLENADEIADVFVKQGLDKNAFLKAFNSFGVTSQVRLADANARGYGITGTPELVVDGRYRVSSGMAGGQAQMLDVVDYLVAKLRAERKQ